MDHRLRTTGEHLIDGRTAQQGGRNGIHFVGIHAAGIQRRVDRFPGEEVEEAQPIEKTVLEVVELGFEDDACLILVGVQQGEPALRLGGQHRLDVGQNGRDARARGKRHIVLALSSVQFSVESAIGRHGLQRIASLELGIGPRAEAAFGHPLDGHPEFFPDPGANAIAAAHRFALDVLIEGQVLALFEGKSLRQVSGHIENDGHAIGSLAAHFGHAQIMKTVRHGVRISE